MRTTSRSERPNREKSKGSGLFDGSFAEKTRTGIASGPVAKAAQFPGDGTQRQNHGEWCWTIPQGARDDFEGFKAIAMIEFNRSRFCVDHHRNASSPITSSNIQGHSICSCRSCPLLWVECKLACVTVRSPVTLSTCHHTNSAHRCRNPSEQAQPQRISDPSLLVCSAV